MDGLVYIYIGSILLIFGLVATWLLFAKSAPPKGSEATRFYGSLLKGPFSPRGDM